jgi:hypothetical protein
MSLGRQYLAKANECNRQACSAGTEEGRLAWLLLAQGWMRLVTWRECHESDFINAEVEHKRTGQETSGATH